MPQDPDENSVTDVEVRQLLAAIRSRKGEPGDAAGERPVGRRKVADDDNQAVAEAMMDIQEDGPSELYFDRRTGEVTVGSVEERTDGLSATRMAREGFFGR